MGYYQNQYTDKPLHIAFHERHCPFVYYGVCQNLLEKSVFGSQVPWETLCRNKSADLRAGSLDHSRQPSERRRVGWMGLQETRGCAAGMTGPSGSHGALWSCMIWQSWSESRHLQYQPVIRCGVWAALGKITTLGRETFCSWGNSQSVSAPS